MAYSEFGFIENLHKIAESDPQRPALFYNDGADCLSYRELDCLSSVIAGKICNLGIGPGTAVIVMMRRNELSIAAEIGVLKAGAVFVPIIPSYPQERVQFISTDSDAKLLIDEDFYTDIAKYISKDNSTNSSECGMDFNPVPPLKEKVMIVYTSGSTGHPKGVVYDIAAYNMSVCRLATHFEDLPTLNFCSFAPMAFIAHMLEYAAVYACGGTTHITSDEVRMNPVKLERYYRNYRISVGFISSKLYCMFKQELPDLKRIILGGEKICNFDPKDMNVTVIYAQTEATDISSYQIDIAREEAFIGTPLPRTEIYILDEQGHDVGFMKEGEICAKGIYPRSYLNLPEETGKTFEETEDGEVIVHTGDIGMRYENGVIRYLNRRDFMVKINGNKVDPSEIEIAMKRIPEVEDAIVKGFETKNGSVNLCGYYVSDQVFETEELKQLLGQSLPYYMVPNYYVRIDEIPKNSNGKPDRSALQKPDMDVYKREYVPAATQTEQVLCDAFEEVLNCGTVGINDSFFALGGDSITVVRFLDNANTLQLTSSMIFEGRTPAGIAALLEEKNADEARIEHSESIYEECPLSEAQKGVYFECINDLQSLKYNLPAFIRLAENIDEKRYSDAIKLVARKHPAFFATVTIIDGIPSMKFREHEVRVKSTEAESLELAKLDFVRPFDLEEGPLYRFEICRIGDERIFFMDIHHIICDGTSINVLVSQIEAAYEGLEIPDEELTLYDVAMAQESLFESVEYHKAQEFFAHRLEGVEEFAVPESDILETFENSETKAVSGLLSVNLTSVNEFDVREVTDFLKEYDITENTLFMGAFAIALSCFVGSDTCGFVTVNNGRHDTRLSQSIGMFVKTLPMCVNIRRDMTVKEFLCELQNDFFKTMEHDCISFGELVSRYKVSPEIMFVYQSEMLNCIEEIKVNDTLAKITAMMFKEQNGYRLNLSFSGNEYSENYMVSFGECVMTVIKSLMSAKQLKEVVLLPAAQKDVLKSFNETESPYDLEETVVDMFRKQAVANPQKTAVIYKDKEYTYSQVNTLSDKIALYLINKGIKSGDVIAVLINRSEYMPIVSLGVLKSGAAYQPLDPSYPEERLGFMVQDTSAKLLVADRDIICKLSDWKGNVLLTEDIPSLPDTEGNMQSVLLAAPKPDDQFVILYTSGSSGTPKGAILCHKNIMAFCHQHIKRLEINESSIVAAYASYGFDANMMDTYPTICSGATLVIVHEEIRLDITAILKYYTELRVTHAFMTTQVARQFAMCCDSPFIKYLSLGGEAVTPVTPPKGVKLINLYGPTECTVYVTAFEMGDGYRRVPIGKAAENTKLYVVNENGQRLPLGAPGELWVAGRQVAKAYLNLPKKTSDVFIDNPFDAEEGYEYIYRTGDVVRILKDGIIDYIGRNDGQVKIRGFRIELTEVEEVIRRFKGIKDAAVIAYSVLTGGKEIAAYVVSDELVDVHALKDFIRNEKPAYMVPSVIMQIEKIPLNQNQKVDKKALPKPEIVSEHREVSGPSYDNAICAKLKEILNSILGENQYDNSEDLSYYGLNSLGIIRLVSCINDEFKVTCDVAELRKECTIRLLEEKIITGLLAKQSQNSTASTKRERADIVPLSGAQTGVYAECLKNPLDTKYNIPFYLQFSPDMDADKLSEAAKHVLLAHHSVFSSIIIDGEKICLKRAEDYSLDIPVITLSEAELKDYRNQFSKPFNLMNSRLFRIEIVKTEKSVYLFNDFHHILFDGTSVGIYTAQLKEVLEGREIPTEEYDYFDYVTDQNADDESYKKAEEYFATMLSMCEKSDEITPDLTGNLDGGSVAVSSVPFDMAKVDEFCHVNKITPAHLFLAAIFYVVSRFTNSKNAYISTISNGRSDIRTQNTFGMFVNTLALGIEIGDITVRELLNQSKEIFGSAMDNEIYPFSQVAARFNYASDIFYAYQIGINEGTYINGQRITVREVGERQAKFKTGIYIEREDEETVINVVYNDARFSKALMDTLSECILATVCAIMDNPDMPVRKLSMLSKESAAVVEGFSAVKIEEPEDTSNRVLNKLFEKQVQKTPDAMAVTAIDASLSYRELNENANRVANALIGKGISNSARVVLLLDRTSKYFAALFGVLKAGAAFIPTCPDYPKERICNIIEDSDAEYVITFGDFINEYGNALDINDLLKCENVSDPLRDIKPDDLAYLIYTSGSTGKPKGVMLSHGGIANYLTDNEYNPQIHLAKENCKCFGSVTTVSFDMNFKETLNALCNGLTLAFASDEMTMDPTLLGEFFIENKVDVFNATPSRLLTYMEVPQFEEAMKNCKVIMAGGDKYPDKLLKVLREKTTARILNTYGPTEITVSSNAAELTNADYISVGKPLYNYKEYIVDLDDNKLPANVVGELIIGGVGVAMGYNKLEEQTAKAFITYEGMKFYRSGDYARFTPNGDVVILGRKDNQIKLRGLRIELGEIEKVLTSVAGVYSGTVVIRKLGREDEICAYYTADREIEASELKAEMSKKLTDYMIPAAFMRLEEMPLTPNGKINVKMLPDPVASKHGRVIEPPVGKAEEDFCEIFKEVLGLDEVSASDSFFDIGGTSLAVVSVVVKASKLNYMISFSDVFNNPSPRRLAKFVNKEVTEPDNPFANISDYDYSSIDRILKGNNLDAFEKGEIQKIGDVILTGATGFLGIHVLLKLLTYYQGKIYCLIRKAGKLPTYFNYYFDGISYDDYRDRITIVEGDITKPESFAKLKEIKADTFINCAANVKHFSEGTDIEDVNYYGVKNILAYCKETGTRLVHVSTMSVGGVYYDKMGNVDKLCENMLYIGQSLTSKYTNSKFLAEREILEAAAAGMNVKIMRVGNLSPRDTDGLFQMNFRTNTSMGRIKASYVLGAHTYSSMRTEIEFSPIGNCAEAILLLSGTPRECVVFHPFNNHSHIMEEVYTAMNEAGLTTRPVSDEEYSKILLMAKQDPKKNRILSSFMAYERADGRKTYTVGKNNDYTMQVLYRMGFRWAVSSLRYMRSFLILLKELGFFEW